MFSMTPKKPVGTGTVLRDPQQQQASPLTGFQQMQLEQMKMQQQQMQQQNQLVSQFLSPQTQQQPQPFDWQGLGQVLHPPSRHLGMGGEDITGQQGPYQSGGLDWLHANNNGSGGIVPIDPRQRQQTQSNMMAAFAPQAQAVQHPMQWTKDLAAPVGQNPGFASAQYPVYQQGTEMQRKKLMQKPLSSFGRF